MVELIAVDETLNWLGEKCAMVRTVQCCEGHSRIYIHDALCASKWCTACNAQSACHKDNNGERHKQARSGMLSWALVHAHARRTVQQSDVRPNCPRTARHAAFAINEPFVLIEGTVLPNLKSRYHHRHHRSRTREREREKERNFSHLTSKNK